jgi:hypothetical protein
VFLADFRPVPESGRWDSGAREAEHRIGQLLNIHILKRKSQGEREREDGKIEEKRRSRREERRERNREQKKLLTYRQVVVQRKPEGSRR